MHFTFQAAPGGTISSIFRLTGLAFLSATGLLVFIGCNPTEPSSHQPPGSNQRRMISPQLISLDVGEVYKFEAADSNLRVAGTSWTATAGTISPEGWYRAPSEPGRYGVIVTYGARWADTASVTVEEPDQPYFNDDFETCSLNRTPNEAGFAWTESSGGADEQPVVSRAIAHTGNCSLKFTYRGGGADGWSEQRFRFGKKLSHLYLRWYQYFPDGLETPSVGPAFKHRNDPEGPDNNKLLRLWDESYSDYNVKAGFSFLPGSGHDSQLNTEYMRRGPTGNKVTLANIGPWKSIVNNATRGRWIKFVVRLRLASSDQLDDGVLQLWLDDTLVADFTNLPLYSLRGSARNYIRHGYLMGWANSGFEELSATYIDDVTISTKPLP